MKHATQENERGWHAYHGKPRNKLNHSNSVGQGRRGTLGSRLSDRSSSSRAMSHNPRIGKVQPEAPVTTKRARLALGADYGETWANKGAAITSDARATTIYHLDGIAYDSYDAWNEALQAKAS